MIKKVFSFFSNQQKALDTTQGLGTFGGVFTPSILTILGVIMYLRFGWVVGNVGLLGGLIILTLANSITFLTGLSISSIATDQHVRVGGAYYMISRSLGIESGGAIGIPLYLAQALSVALYVIGFSESMVQVFPHLSMKYVGIVTTIGVTALALLSAKAAIKAQYVIMLAIFISLVSFFFGSEIEPNSVALWAPKQTESESFWKVFAVFFPAVTGIMAGVNMSGNLKNPSKSIPKGTMYAIGTGYIIYAILLVLLSLRATPFSLINDPFVMQKMAFWGDAIILGIWGATLSSAVGSIMGAPRVLQALARDKVLPDFLQWLGKGSDKDDTPRNGTLLTMMIALGAVWLGDLNLIAPILSMFFLTTYGVINVSAGLETFLDSPSFRPRFRVHWIFPLLGTIGCVAVMFLINVLATLVAFIIILIVFFWIEQKSLKTDWGDLNRGIHMAIIKQSLLRIGSEYEPKTWRPNPLVLSGSPRKRWHLIDFARSINANKGLLTVATVLNDEKSSYERVQTISDEIYQMLLHHKIQGLVRVITSSDAFTGAVNLVQSYGLGLLVPNTIILGDSEDETVRESYCLMIRRIYEMKRNIILVRNSRDSKVVFGDRKQIHLWWGGFKGNGGLMLILAHLLKESHQWRNAHLQLNMVVNEESEDEVRKNIGQILHDARIDADIFIIKAKQRPFVEILHEVSSHADTIFLGMAQPDEHFVLYYQHLQELTKNLPTTIFVLAGQDISFGDVLLKKEESAITND